MGLSDNRAGRICAARGYWNYFCPLAKLFFRGKDLVFFYAFSLLMSMAGFIVLLLPSLGHQAGGSVQGFFFSFLVASPLTALFLFAAAGFTALQFARSVFQADGLLSVVRNKRSRLKIAFSVLAFLLTLWIVPLVSVVTVLFAFGLLLDFSASELRNVISVAVLGIGGASLIGVLLGFFLGKSFNRATAYSLLVAVFIFISPLVAEVLSALLGHLPVSTRLFLHWSLIAPFEFVPPLFTVPLDTVYLLPVEPHRWLLTAIWTVVIFVALALSIVIDKAMALRTAIFLFVGLLIPWSIYGAQISHPHFSDLSSRDIQEISMMLGIFENDVFSPTVPLHSLTDHRPQVEKYEMELNIGSQLHAKVVIFLEEPFEEAPAFTLFKGYRVDSISNSQGQILDFEREGNFITVTTPGQENEMIFTIEYTGSGWAYYASRQGVFLSSAFPWYPWMGRQPFYWEFPPYIPNWQYGDPILQGTSRRAYRAIDESTYKIQVRSNLAAFNEIHTSQGSFPLGKDDFFELNSRGLTLMAGQLDSVGDCDTFTVIGGSLTVDILSNPEVVGYNLSSPYARQEIIDEVYSLRRQIGILDYGRLSARTIIIVPTYPRYTNLYEIPVFMGDHILVSDGGFRDVILILALQNLFVANDYENKVLSEMLYEFLLDPEWLPFLQGIEDGYWLTIQDYLFLEAIEMRGEHEVIKEIVRYLQDDSQNMTSIDFLQLLGKEGGLDADN